MAKDQDGLIVMTLTWKTPSPEQTTSLWSEVGDGIDYYFVYGPETDRVIGGYRQITGPAPMMPVWSFGLWQQPSSATKTAQESFDVIDGFRSRNIPFDNIVQDWFYWKETRGRMNLDPGRASRDRRWVPLDSLTGLRVGKVLSGHRELRSHALARLLDAAELEGRPARLGRLHVLRCV